MMLKNSRAAYGAVTKAFHWGMAVLILFMLCLGLYMEDLSFSNWKLELYALHKSIGITILGLVILRLLWRLINTLPPLPSHMRPLEKKAAHGAHWALYGLMFFMPLTGWLMSSAAGFPVNWFGLYQLPDMISAAEFKEYREWFEEVHEYGAFVLMGLLGLHVTGALWHHFKHKDPILKRMLPFVKMKEDKTL